MNTLKDVNERVVAKVCGENIKHIREKAGYTQEELADLLGCSDVTIGKVERGVQTMKLWRLIRICEMFHVSLDYLLRGVEYSDLSPVPSYLVKLYHDADAVEMEILTDHMMSADREIGRKHVMEDAYKRTDHHD